jgi:glutamine amidotransferase
MYDDTSTRNVKWAIVMQSTQRTTRFDLGWGVLPDREKVTMNGSEDLVKNRDYVIDYEMGNVGSVLNMLRKLGVPAKLTGDPAELARAHGIILPGVGSFDRGMQRLNERGLVAPLQDLVLEKRKPLLGICLGMQLMAAGSQEGSAKGLGWFDSHVQLFKRDPAQPQLRIPHMGWNFIAQQTPVHPLLADLPPDPRFYFVHSYFFPADIRDAIATTHHIIPFTSVLARDNILGCQFHPEKSHSFGLGLLKNFSQLALGRASGTAQPTLPS